VNRIQSFEFNERNECPEFIRDGIVEILGKGIRWSKYFSSSIQAFIEFANQVETTTFLDLCSGSGEPAAFFVEELLRQGKTQFKFVLSDLFPKTHSMNSVSKQFPEQTHVITTPVDATNVKQEYDQAARTIINAFHHFPPELAKSIIRDCVKKERGIFIIESFPRSVIKYFSVIPYLLVSFFVNPFITQKDRLLKFLFSFIIPLIPVLGFWDGLISSCRIHSKDELFEMVDEWKLEYTWNYQEIPFFPFGRAVVFWGIPQKCL